MTEAEQAIINYGFECLGLNRIEAHTFPQNTRSVSLLRRQHFKEEGTFRQNSYFKGKFWDEVFFSLLKEDWSRQQIQNGREAGELGKEIEQWIVR